MKAHDTEQKAPGEEEDNGEEEGFETDKKWLDKMWRRGGKKKKSAAARAAMLAGATYAPQYSRPPGRGMGSKNLLFVVHY